MIGLSLNRTKHCLGVARKMKAIADSISDFPYPSHDMFYLGLLHDVAYEFVESPEEHEHRGGEILRENDYRYWQEVYHHGNPDTPYRSLALDLLNYADLTTSPEGEDISMEDRLDDIANRYGKDSLQYCNARKLSLQLKNSRFTVC